MPHDLEAETSVLGAILLDSSAIGRILDSLRAEDFYRENNGAIYQAALNLYREGEPIDTVTMAAELLKAGVLERVGGRAHLALLQVNCPTAENIETYAAIVRDKALKRELVKAGQASVALGLDDSRPAVEVIDKAQAAHFALTRESVGAGLVVVREELRPTMDRIHSSAAGEMAARGVSSGFPDLDRLTNGFKPGQLVIIGGATGMGKALALDTPIPTPAGWVTMADLRVGDHVFDEAGQPCMVTFATPTQYGRDCYEVLFDDGERIVADADHLWAVSAKTDRRGPRRPPPRVMNTRAMAESVRVWSHHLNYMIPACGALQYPPAALPVDPYVLGAWLGDGTTSSPVITVAEQEMVENLIAAGCPLRRRRARGAPQFGMGDGRAWITRTSTRFTRGDIASIRLRSAEGVRNKELAAEYGVAPEYISHIRAGRRWRDIDRPMGVPEALKGLGVIGRKHIPRLYQEASVDQRLALLQGLMDTDGHIDRLGHAEFTSISSELAGDVLALVVGLGLTPRLTEGRALLNGRDCGPRYRVRFKPTDLPVFRLSRKAARQAPVSPNAACRQRAIMAINRVSSVPVRCIQVDSIRHLYLAGRSCVPTHNTSFADQIAVRAAIEDRVPTAIFSLEMSRPELVLRMLCEQARVDSQRLARGMVGDDEVARLVKALGPLGDAPVWVDDCPVLDEMALRLKARQAKARLGIDLVVVDYLQLMTSSGKSDGRNRVQEVSVISRGLKAIARELEITVLALAQLSRAPQSRPDKRPVLSDLRESGSIEMDADIVMFIYRDEYYNREKSEKPGIAEVIVAKHRSGPTGTVELLFRKEYTRFENLERRRPELGGGGE